MKTKNKVLCRLNGVLSDKKEIKNIIFIAKVKMTARQYADWSMIELDIPKDKYNIKCVGSELGFNDIEENPKETILVLCGPWYKVDINTVIDILYYDHDCIYSLPIAEIEYSKDFNKMSEEYNGKYNKDNLEYKIKMYHENISKALIKGKITFNTARELLDLEPTSKDEFNKNYTDKILSEEDIDSIANKVIEKINRNRPKFLRM